VKLAIIGSGTKNCVKKLRTEISKKKLWGNIELLGFLSEPEKFRIMKSSKMLLFPSNYESWGIVACEAMACGIPVVAYNLPVYEEIFPQGMLMAPVGDSEKFAELVMSLLNDGTKCKKLGDAALETVARYDWDKIAEMVSEILEKC
jgi:glycosyltransferase involved in cell wall biosynthesis